MEAHEHPRHSLCHLRAPAPPLATRTLPRVPPCLRSALHEHFPVIPEPIREYIEEVKGQLEEVANSPGGWVGGGGEDGRGYV
jgi:hypothetical protein